MSRSVPNEELPVTISSNYKTIPNVYKLPRIGAGHDGYIFQFNNQALKLLKYDITLRKEQGLMTFEKALYFKDHLHLQRITQPTDILLNQDGVYTGYVMPYIDDLTSPKKKGTPRYRQPGDFSCGDLIESWDLLEQDFSQMTANHVRAKDINRGSYLFGSDFMYLCDMDKYEVTSGSPADMNQSSLNFAMAKFLAYEMEKSDAYDKSRKREIDRWVKKQSNSRGFFQDIQTEIGSDYGTPISEFTDYKVKTLLR